MANKASGSMRTPTALALAAGFFAGVPHAAHADIVKLVLSGAPTPAFGGQSFGAVGSYEKLTGTAYGELDPADPANALITDIALAPRNAHGMVEYSTSVVILRPVDPARGNHELLYEANNRGNKLMISTLDVFSSATSTITSANNPTTAGDAGNGWLLRQGYTIAWSGWDALVAPANNALTMTVPVAHHQDGSTITGPSLEEFETNTATATVEPLTYPAADPTDTTGAQLTVREHYADAPVPVTGWSYVTPASIALVGGAAFTQGRLYEFSYKAKDPLVEGIGLAAVHDVVSFLRHGAPHLESPLGRDIRYAVSFSISQPGRMMRDFVSLGFNRDRDGSRVFDGVDNYIAGGNGIFLNYRFAQPGRTERQHIARWYPEARFPFAWQDSTDPVSGRTAGRLDTCRRSETCPRIVESFSENEYWAKANSLLTTDPTGQRDLPPTPWVRFYQFASHPHAAGSGLGICAQTQNPLLANAGLRALLVDLDAWIRGRALPPDSRTPSLDGGTLAPSLPQQAVGFPTIPGVEYNGIKTIRDSYDFGPLLDRGIITVEPPRYRGGVSPTDTRGLGIYPSYVPVDDADGNNLAGIRMPDVVVPVATFSGWNLQGPAYAAGDGCDASGQMVPFPLTDAAGKAVGDPRRSIAGRYPTLNAYVDAITRSADRLERERFLLPEDVDAYAAAAQASLVGTPALSNPEPLAH